MENLRKTVSSLIKGEVSDDADSLIKYSRDASLFEVRPQLAVWPKNVDDLRALVKFASQNEGISLTARSGGTDMTGGPLTESIVLDFTKYFNNFEKMGDAFAVTQPGVFYRDFEKHTLEKGFLLPTYPASREICTVGGMVANNSGGEKTLTYGDTGDYVDQLAVVLADGNEYILGPLDKAALDKKMAQDDFEGEIYKKMYKIVSENDALLKDSKPKVSKNSAGYLLWDVWDGKVFNLAKLFAGSQGTLGIISKIKFNLIKPKKFSSLLVIFLPDFKNLAEIVKNILEFKPESFESYDDHTFKLAMQFLPDLAKQMGAKHLLSLGLQFLPEFWMFVSGGAPKLIMLAEFTGDDSKEILERAKAAQASIENFGIKTHIAESEKEAMKYWTVRRESFNLLRHHSQKERTAPFIDDVIVRPDQLPEFLPKLNEILDGYKITYTIAGHVGDANFHIVPLMDMTKPESKQIIPELARKVYDLVFSFHGSMTGEHNDGLIRTPYLKEMYGEKIYSLFKEVKDIFDPKNIFNPGKKVGGSLEYAMEHLNS